MRNVRYYLRQRNRMSLRAAVTKTAA
jgi:hypothetical protein